MRQPNEAAGSDSKRLVPFTSGQASAWMNCEGLDTYWLVKPRYWSIPRSVTMEVISSAVRFLMDRHEMMRTVVVSDADWGIARQVGPIDGDLLQVREDLQVDLSDEEKVRVALEPFAHEEFDVQRERPVRWLLGTQPSGDHALVALVHHLASGYQGCGVIHHELPVVLENLVSGRDPANGLLPAHGPSDLLAAEDSTTGRQLDAHARSHIRRMLEKLPSVALPPLRSLDSQSVPAVDPTLRIGLTLTSKAANFCVAALAREWRVPESAVVLAAMSLAIRPQLVDEKALVWQLFGDRAGKHARAAAVSYEPVLTLVDAAGLDESDELRPAAIEMANRLFGALRRRAFGDTLAIEEAHHVSRARGVRVETPFWYNFLPRGEPEKLSLDEISRQLDDLRKADQLDVYEGDQTPGTDFLLYAWRESEHLQLGLYAHRYLVDDELLRAVFARFTQVLYRSAVPSARLEAEVLAEQAPERSGWRRLQNDRWADPSVVSAVLESLEGVESVDVRVTGPSHSRLLAAEITTSTDLSIEDLRTSALSKLDVRGFAIPDVIQTSGGQPGVDRPASAALTELTAVICRMCSLPRIDPLTSYLSGGGSVRAVPSILAVLKARGWSSPTWRELCSHRSVEEIAQTLRRA